MRSRSRFRRPKKKKIGEWPESAPEPESIAAKVRYVGSAEHKNHPSHVGPPALRSDATACEPAMTRDIERNTEALREGIRRGCVSSLFDGEFPRYVWAWVGEDLYEARHIYGPLGTYKGYRLNSGEEPLDPDGRLGWE